MNKLEHFLKSKYTRYTGIAILVLFFSLKAWDGGNDINVYLHASRTMWEGGDIYSGNPYNDYLYSPLFAMLLWPLAFFPWEFSRVLWALFNLFIIFRLWKIFTLVLDHTGIRRYRTIWHLILMVASAGFIIHNLNLGQITVVILWMTLEGILSIMHRKPWRGATLLALGINIKVIPVIALGYLFLKRKYRSAIYTMGLTAFAFLLPALFIGVDDNHKLLKKWKDTINPVGKEYVFEDNSGCQSLNAVLPAYFYDFPANEMEAAESKKYDPQIASISYSTLRVVLNFMRFLLLFSVLIAVFYMQSSHSPLNTYWQIAYLMLVSLIIFPHQMKYSMLYFIPAAGYLLAYDLHRREHKISHTLKEKIILCLAGFQVLVMAITGRDTIGDEVVDFLDHHHFMGLSNLTFVTYLLLLNPKELEGKGGRLNEMTGI